MSAGWSLEYFGPRGKALPKSKPGDSTLGVPASKSGESVLPSSKPGEAHDLRPRRPEKPKRGRKKRSTVKTLLRD